MYLTSFLCFCLCTLTVLSLLAKWLPPLRASVLAYGKLSSTADRPRSWFESRLAQITVPKFWFAHFYLVGFTFAVYCCLEISTWHWAQVKGPLLKLLFTWDDVEQDGNRVRATECLASLYLFTAHLARRLYESYYVERPSGTARMHISHYLAGLGFYGAVVFATWIEGIANLGFKDEEGLNLSCAIPAILLFIYASKHQHACHCILASLRNDDSSSKQQRYGIPRGDWFETIVAPHYLADILIYASLCILHRFQNRVLLCALIWTVINLSITASETRVWYQKTFGDKYKAAFPRGRWTIIPFLY